MFSHYRPFFKRVIGANDFINKRVCELIFMPKPMLLFIEDRSRQSSSDGALVGLSSCSPSEKVVSPLFQRWNLIFHAKFNRLGLTTPTVKSNRVFRVIVLRKSGTSMPSQGQAQHIGHVDDGHTNSTVVKIFFDELTASLQRRGHRFLRTINVERVAIEEMDTSSVSLQKQVAVVAKAHVLVGAHGSGINALSVHMPIGVTHCCSVVELFTGGTRPSLLGYRNAAQSMGHRYSRVDVQVGQGSSKERSEQVQLVIQAVDTSISLNKVSPTCILQETETGFS